MQILIDIPKEDYDYIQEVGYANNAITERLYNVIADGTPLPKSSESPAGRWIKHERGFWTRINMKGERDGWIPDYECNLCGSRGWKFVELMNFCPSCGADMRGGKDEISD